VLPAVAGSMEQVSMCVWVLLCSDSVRVVVCPTITVQSQFLELFDFPSQIKK
jgi:hypothetical protein